MPAFGYRPKESLLRAIFVNEPCLIPTRGGSFDSRSPGLYQDSMNVFVVSFRIDAPCFTKSLN
jgi:hypothetical protein